MGALAFRGWRFATAVGLALGAAVVAPVACLFPSYTYTLSGSGGSNATSTGSTTTSSTGSMSGGGMAATTSSGGGSTATSTSSSSAASSSGSCPTMNCGDPSCTSYACVPVVPAGWTGPVELFEGAKAPAGCGTDYPTQAYVGNDTVQVPQAVCNCMCNAATGQTCAATGVADQNHSGTVDAILVTDAPCGTPPFCIDALETPTAWDWSCYGGDGAPAGLTTCGTNANPTCSAATPPAGTAPCNQSVRVNALTLTGGSCTPNTQPPTLPPVTWMTEALACGDTAQPGTGCTGGASCLPIPTGGFLSTMCIMQTGVVTCPPQFPTTYTFYGSTMESRTCTTCGCGAASGGSCTATVTVATNGLANSCPGSGVTLTATTASDVCVDVTNATTLGSRKGTNVSITMPGSCPATSQPMGTVTAIDPTTFCCVK